MKTQSQCKRLSRNNERDMLFNPTPNHAQKPNPHVQNVTCTFIRVCFFVWAVLIPPTPPDTMLKANMVRIISSTLDPADQTPQHCIRGAR